MRDSKRSTQYVKILIFYDNHIVYIATSLGTIYKGFKDSIKMIQEKKNMKYVLKNPSTLL